MLVTEKSVMLNFSKGQLVGGDGVIGYFPDACVEFFPL